MIPRLIVITLISALADGSYPFIAPRIDEILIMPKESPFISSPVKWLFVLLLLSSLTTMFNVTLFTSLNSFHSNLSDIFWVSMTTLGDGLLLGIILGMFLMVNPRITVFGLILILATSLTINVIKSILPALRPVEALGTVHIVGPVLRSGSFPSGHAAAAFATSLALAHFSPSRVLKVILVLFGILVGFSRIFVGAHFPNDVIWGIILALSLYELLRVLAWPKIERYVPNSPPIKERFFQALLSLEIATSIFCLVIYSQVFAEYPPAAIAVSSGVLTFFIVAVFKSVKN